MAANVNQSFPLYKRLSAPGMQKTFASEARHQVPQGSIRSGDNGPQQLWFYCYLLLPIPGLL